MREPASTSGSNYSDYSSCSWITGAHGAGDTNRLWLEEFDTRSELNVQQPNRYSFSFLNVGFLVFVAGQFLCGYDLLSRLRSGECGK